jgi:hypothetical protein
MSCSQVQDIDAAISGVLLLLHLSPRGIKFFFRVLVSYVDESLRILGENHTSTRHEFFPFVIVEGFEHRIMIAKDGSIIAHHAVPHAGL